MPGGDTKRLITLKAICTLLEGITQANEYDFDLNGKVFRGRAVFAAETPAPFVSIVESEGGDPNTIIGGRFKEVRLDWWELMVQGWVNPKLDEPTDELYRLLGAVEHRLARILPSDSPDYRLGGLVADCSITPGVVRAATPEIGGVECFFLPIRLQFAMSLADPWNTSQLRN